MTSITKSHFHILESTPRTVSMPTKKEIYDAAVRRMIRGKKLVIGGFIVAIAGIIGYCVACLGASMNPDLSAALLDNPRWLVGPALGVIGLGTLLWLAGSFMYLSGAMDSDPNGTDLNT